MTETHAREESRLDARVRQAGPPPVIRCARALGLVCAAAALGGCALAPPDVRETRARAPAEQGGLERLGRRIEAELAPGESAAWLLERNDAAYEARLALAEQAVDTLDVQYFLWNDDAVAHYLARRVIAAAERGVRVRVLLDDLALNGHDTDYAALDAHPNIQVRTFNPWRSRTKPGRFIEFLLRFGKLNHRMHNKAVIADNWFAITGGRNVGDHYFGLDPEFVQNDLDVLMAGPAVRDISDHFDLYWNSAEAYPVEAVLTWRHRERTFDDVVAEIEDTYTSERELLREFLPSSGNHGEFLQSIADSYAAGPVDVYYDLPLIDIEDPVQLYEDFQQLIGGARSEVLISSPYFVPDQGFVDLLGELRERGVRVVVLTNSLGANNHTTAHSAYKQWRRKALRADVELYEARHDAESLSYYVTPPIEAERLGLHTKSVIVDRRLTFIGSPNVDPRSMILNTEMGVVVDDAVFAERLRGFFERDIAPENAWRVTLRDDNFLVWTSDEGSIMHQPARGFLQRFAEFFINLVPIKNQT